MCSQLEPDPDSYTIPQIDEQDDENADTVQKTRQTTLSFVPSAMASSRRKILRQPMDRGHFRQRSDGDNVFIDKTMQGYTPFLLKLVRQQRLIRKLEEVDEDILFGCFSRIVVDIHSNVLIGVMQGDLAKRYPMDKETHLLSLQILRPQNHRAFLQAFITPPKIPLR
jgi:cytochrome P450